MKLVQFTLLIRLAVTTWAVILGKIFFDWSGALFVIAILVAIFLLETRFIRNTYRDLGPESIHSPTVLITLCITLGVLAAMFTALFESQRFPDELQGLTQSTHELTIEVTGYCSEDIFDLSKRCTGKVSTDSSPQATARILFQESVLSDPVIGRTYLVKGSLYPYTNMGNTAYHVTVKEILDEEPEHALNAWLNAVRSGLRNATLAFPDTGGSLIPGMVMGDTVFVSAELDDAMKETSLSHLTAVSGSNFSMVVLTSLVLMRRMRLQMSLQLGIGFLILTVFFLLVTDEPSVMRASVMMVISLFAQHIGRPGNGENILGLCIIVLLFYDPSLAIQFGFALSAFATAGLMFSARPLANVLKRYLPEALADIISIPLVAQMYCQPILLLLEPALPTFGVLANVLAAPFAPFATGLGLLAAIMLNLLPSLGYLLTALAWLPSEVIGRIALFLSNLPGAKIPWLSHLPGALVFVAALILAFMIRRRWIMEQRRFSFRRSRFMGVYVFGIILLSGVTVWALLGRAPDIPQQWDIAVCDVGQGDALLVKSETKTLLIDAGPDPKKLSLCLTNLKITTIDTFVISHFDLDHVYGITALTSIEVKQVLFASERAGDVELLQRVLPNSSHHRVHQGMRTSVGEQDIEILWPHQEVAFTNQNDASVVVNITGSYDFLSLGDLSGNAQRLFYALNQNLKQADVVKISHHGSADQLPELYDYLYPEVGLISVGKNSYGHPSDQVLEMFEGREVLRTDKNGMVLLAIWPAESHLGDSAGLTDPKELLIEHEGRLIETPTHKIWVWTER